MSYSVLVNVHYKGSQLDLTISKGPLQRVAPSRAQGALERGSMGLEALRPERARPAMAMVVVEKRIYVDFGVMRSLRESGRVL